MLVLFTGVWDHLDLLKAGLKVSLKELVSQLYQQVSLPVLGVFLIISSDRAVTGVYTEP